MINILLGFVQFEGEHANATKLPDALSAPAAGLV